jgi:CheY-like chemotaxis protein
MSRTKPKKTILYLEGIAEVRNPVAELLRLEGYDVVEKGRNENALISLRVRKKGVDLIICDSGEGEGFDGREFVKTVREDPRYSRHKETPIVGTGIFPFPKQQANYLSSFLIKPFRSQQLSEAVRQAIGS